MSDQSTPRVDVIAISQFTAPDDIPWQTDADGGQALAEFAGRACYRSWDKPNPATATNAGYLNHVIEVGHLSVLEHAQATVYIRGISRSATHELIRHRHFSYSQLSQRHVIDDPAFVVPGPVAGDDELNELFASAADRAREAYDQLIDGIEQRLDGAEGAARSKRARQAAQALLPIHWATFVLARHSWDEPIERLLAAVAAEGGARLAVPRPGERVELAAAQPQGEESGEAAMDTWWRRL